jgi:transposase InsO family protein
VEEHDAVLERAFQLLEQHQFYLKLSKCQFQLREVNYLGHIIGADGVKPDPAKTQVVRDWPAPQNKSQLRSFVGLATWFRKFIQGFSKLTQPLTALFHDKVPWHWSPECQHAFDSIKAALTSAPVLALPDFTKPFRVICDASDYGIGAVLLQNDQPVAWESRRYSDAERNYSPTDQEALAVIHALKVWRCYLESGQEVSLVTDHNPNTYWPTKTDMSPRRARWIEFLSRFNYKWQYIPGRQNVADPISRHSAFKEAPAATLLGAAYVAVATRRATKGHTDEAPAPAQLPEPAKELQPPSNTNPNLSPVRLNEYATFAVAYEKDPFFAKPRNLRNLVQRHGVWWQGTRIAVPDDPTIKSAILYELHNAPYSGHVGVDKTLAAVKRRYWWPGMKRYVVDYISRCHKCQSNKASNSFPAGLLMPLPTPEQPWDSVSVDFVTCLPMTHSGHDAVVVFVDRLTKMVHIAPTTTSVTAAETAKLYVDHVWKHHGIQLELISDRGTQFTSHFFEELTRLVGTQQCLSTAYHPQSDGQTERVNRVLQDMLRHYVSATQDDWDEYLSVVEFAINNSDHASTGASPFMLNYGRAPRTPFDISTAATRPRNSRVHAAQELRTRIQNILADAKRMLNDAKSRQKLYADRKRTDASLEPGQWVMLNTKNLRFKGPTSRKLLPKWLGPFKVQAAVNPVAYTLELPPTMKCHPTFHISLLKPFRSDGPVIPPPPPLMVDDDGGEWFTIEAILDHRERTRKVGRATKVVREYKIRWQGYTPEHDTWEPESNVAPSEMGETLRRYYAFRGLPLPRELE